MDDPLPVLLSFPPHPQRPDSLSDQQYDDAIKLQVDSVRKIPTRNLLADTSSGEHILNVIDPTLNTVSYVAVLLANIDAFQSQSINSMTAELLWQKIVAFLDNCDPIQIRYIGTEFSQVIASAANIARRAQQPAIAITPIANAILRLDESASTFTSAHLILARLSLESKAYGQATRVLDRHVLYFPGLTYQSKPKYLCSRALSGPSYITVESGLTEKLKYQDVLEYFLFSGTIYVALHQWEKALNYLECAVTYPIKDNVISKIMVEAYKKWTLVNVLLQGKAGSLPTTTNSNVAKSFHTLAKPYDILASLCESASASRLQAEVSMGQDVWKDDGNLGLVLFVLASYQKFQIRNLASVYRTIAISEVTRMTVSAETGNPLPSDQAMEVLILQMIADGDLHATLSRPTDSQPVLIFSANGPALPESEVQRQLSDSFERMKTLAGDIKSTDRRLTYDKDFLKWAHKQRKLERSGLSDGLSAEEMVWNPAEEEDLMSGNF